MTTRTVDGPLQVYLDSSDISILSGSCGVEAWAAEISAQLQRWQAAGEIEMRFSYVHVAEAAPITLEHVSSATTRLDCLHRLCWPHALAAPSDVFEAEAQSLLSGEISNDSYRRDDGNWLPSDLGDLALPSVEAVLRNAIQEHAPTREQRRAALRSCFSRDGTMTREGTAQLASFAPAFVETVRQQFPLTIESASAVEQYAKGNISGEDAMRSVMNSMRDLRVFSEWLQSRWTEVSPTTAWLRERGKRLQQSLAKASDQTNLLWQQQVAAGLSEERIRRIAANALESQRKTFVLRQVAAALDVQTDVFDTTREPGLLRRLAPGTHVSADGMFEIARQACMQPKQRRRPAASDAGDLAHCLYLSYVDVFRADAFTADAIKKAVPEYSSRVVPKLRDLPGEIHRRLLTLANGP